MQLQQFQQTMQFPQPAGGVQFGANKLKNRSTKKLTKADISMPTDFKHVVHVGWTAQKGFDLNGEEVNSLNAFLEKAGVSEQQLNDRETRAFIYDFIQSNNVLDSVKHEQDSNGATTAQMAQPPPVPSRHHVSLNLVVSLVLVNYIILLLNRTEHNGLHRLHHLRQMWHLHVSHHRLYPRPYRRHELPHQGDHRQSSQPLL